jgi:hypothetical protein
VLSEIATIGTPRDGAGERVEREEKGQGMAKSISAKSHVPVEMVSADLSDIEDVRSIIPVADTSANPRRERPPASGSVNRCVCDGALFASLGRNISPTMSPSCITRMRS